MHENQIDVAGSIITLVCNACNEFIHESFRLKQDIELIMAFRVVLGLIGKSFWYIILLFAIESGKKCEEAA
ncbi:MAG TPA: hypothetical protein DIU00_14340 [Phycisphaerales bacterium]|nr:hypothetical protein [Phycisphaerales bacterium]